MGIGRKIALTGGGAIAAILLIAFVANRTGILQKFSSGLGNIGNAIGLGVGTGVANIPKGVVEGVANVYRDANTGYDLLGLKKGYSDFLKALGLEDPFAGLQPAYVDPYSPTSVSPQGIILNPNISDPSIVTPAQRALSDAIKNAGFGSYGKITGYTTTGGSISSGGRVASVSRSVSVSSQQASRAASPSRASSFAKTQAAARARAKARKRGKCYNDGLPMGGVGQIIYRDAGVFGPFGAGA